MYRRALTSLVLLLACTGDRPMALHLAGDSTMAAKLATKRPETGWGEMLQGHFDPRRVRVVNHAKNGRSTRTFISEGLWRELVGSLREGDVVLIQFGHNDAVREKADRYTTPRQYRANLLRFLRETRARGAVPILLTPVARRRFDEGGAVVDTHGEYPDVVRALAAEQGAPLVDLQRESERVLREHGPERSRELFLHLQRGEHPNYRAGVADDTHFSPRGAAVMAQLFVDAIRAQRLDLARHIVPEGGDSRR